MAAQKKVIVRLFPLGILRGYLPPSGFVDRGETPTVRVLDLAGRVQVVLLQEVKAINYVRDFNVNDQSNPERLPRRTFLARPRAEGLWIRISLRDEEQIEGLASLDLGLADGFADDLGIQFTPPDVRGNTQRMYVPRSAMTALQVVAVVTTPSRRRLIEAGGQTAMDDRQFSLLLPDDAGGVQAASEIEWDGSGPDDTTPEDATPDESAQASTGREDS